MHISFVVVLVLCRCLLGAGLSCSCDSAVHTASRRRLRRSDVPRFKKVPSVFQHAKMKGDTYVRPPATSTRYQSLPLHAQNDADPACTTDQIHISLGDELSSMVVSFATYSNDTTPSKVTYSVDENAVLAQSSAAKVAMGSFRTHSQLLYIINNLVDPSMGQPTATEEEIVALQDTKSWAYDKDTGEHWFNWKNVTSIVNGYGAYNNPYMYYDSPKLHTVILTKLEPLTTYYYRVQGSCQIYRFTMPAYYYGDASPSPSEQFPFKIGLVGDLGQTEVSLKSMQALRDMDPDVALLVGDLSYADGYTQIWDSFGQAIEVLASEVPLMTTGGNHEVQNGENWMPYQLRYKTPYIGAGSSDPAFWGREIGPLHVIAVNSYANTSNTSLQYAWLEMYLSTRVNRERTPWVLLMLHVPLYCSNTVHWKEGELARRSLEGLIYQYGVDIVLSGHIHAYERTLNLFNENLDQCGPNYLVIGDGGNYEGPATPWRNISDSPWSAFRESSFGVGQLDIVNSTHAHFVWNRHACGSSSSDAYYMNFSSGCSSPGDNSVNAFETSDEVWFIKPVSTNCANRWYSTSYEILEVSASSSGNDDDDDSKDKAIITSLAVLSSVLGAAVVVMAFVIVYLYKAVHDDPQRIPLAPNRPDTHPI